MKIALLQILPAGSEEENRNKGAEYCRRAKAAGADIALFPEMWSCGYRIPESAAELQALALPADGEFVCSFGELARELQMAVGITFLEKYQPSPRNSFVLFDRFGRRVLSYAKVHTCDFGEEKYLTAGNCFPVAGLDTAEGNVRVGAMICYDREFPESARILMLEGAELVFVPNACPMRSTASLSCARGRSRTCLPSRRSIILRVSPIATGIPRYSTESPICPRRKIRAIPAFWRRAKKRGCILRTSICGHCGRTGKAKCTATHTAVPKNTACLYPKRSIRPLSVPIGENNICGAYARSGVRVPDR